MNTLELVKYYADLLILQYAAKARAYPTIKTLVTPVVIPQTSVQEITFSAAPDAGNFVLSYGVTSTSPILWNDTAATIQTYLRAITGLSAVVVTGSIASKTLTITFDGVMPVAEMLVVDTSTLTLSSVAVTVSIDEVDPTLPLAIQDGFNLLGDSTAVGDQLDVLAKYVGVQRTGYGFTTQITLTDDELLSLIRFAIIRNNAGSSLYEIQNLLQQFFADQVFVADYGTMLLTFYIASTVASEDLIEMIVIQDLLPRPMAVGLIIITFSGTNAFAFDGCADCGGFGDLSDPSIGGEFASLFTIP